MKKEDSTDFSKFDNKFSTYEDPMSRPRVTLIGELKKTKDPNHKKRFISRHPVKFICEFRRYELL